MFKSGNFEVIVNLLPYFRKALKVLKKLQLKKQILKQRVMQKVDLKSKQISDYEVQNRS